MPRDLKEQASCLFHKTPYLIFLRRIIKPSRPVRALAFAGVGPAEYVGKKRVHVDPGNDHQEEDAAADPEDRLKAGTKNHNIGLQAPTSIQ